MVSRSDFPETLFHDCDPKNRDYLGHHLDDTTATIEQRSKKALWELLKLVNVRPGDTAELRHHIQSIEDEVNACEQELGKWPVRWRGMFYQYRTMYEMRVNDHWRAQGVALNLPWGYVAPDFQNKHTQNPKRAVQEGQRLGRAGPSGSATQQAAAAALRRQTTARPEEGHVAPQHDRSLESSSTASTSAPRRHRHRQIPPGAHGTRSEVRQHLSAEPAPATTRATTQQRPTNPFANTPTFQNMTERTQRQIELERINPDIARFGGVVNAFKPDEDPLSRPLQGQEGIITLVDEENHPQHEFHLVHGQYSQEIHNMVQWFNAVLREDRESDTSGVKLSDVALTAIQEGLVEQVAESAKAGGDIWVVGKDRLEIARAFLDMDYASIGKWTLFGIGVGMSENKLYLLQKM